ncbi:metal ABC transporter ATP-binding protein [Ruminococcaceae bacterium OttesenSCG-928-A16]|nr:metal ABC transporter ATP-binding protein [Ruminococcaceae bacterium OttesenSCG-928-A16]
MPLITCQNLTMAYDKRIAVQNVSFVVNPGDYLFVIGENGAGKSTLMKGILGLMKPVSGHIEYNGIAQKQIGYLPQQTMVQKDFPASVQEVVLSGCLNSTGLLPFYTAGNKAQAAAALAKLGIASLQKRCYRDLSGGQQQRVLLARALCATSKLLVLDEPVAGLDPIATTEMYSIIQQLNQSGITVLMISHDIHSAVTYGNKILQLSGHEVFFGSTAQYLQTQPGHRMMEGHPL